MDSGQVIRLPDRYFIYQPKVENEGYILEYKGSEFKRQEKANQE